MGFPNVRGTLFRVYRGYMRLRDQGFLKSGAPFWGSPRFVGILFFGSVLGSPYLGNCHIFVEFNVVIGEAPSIISMAQNRVFISSFTLKPKP